MNLKKHKSQMLVISLLVFALSISLGIGFLGMSRTNFRIVDNQAESIDNYYLAESAVEIAKYRLQSNFSGYCLNALNQPIPDIITLADGRRITIRVSNEYGTSERDLTVQVNSGRVHGTGTRHFQEVEAVENIVWFVDFWAHKAVKLDAQGNVLTEATGLTGARFVDVNPETGDVWVGTSSKLYKLDKNGNPLKTISGYDVNALAVDYESGDLWIATSDQVIRFDPNGVRKEVFSGFSSPKGIDINEYQNGDVWVADTNNNQIVRIKKISGPAYLEERISTFQGQPFSRPYSVSIDQSGGNVYISQLNTSATTSLYVYDRMKNEKAKHTICKGSYDMSFDPNTNYLWLGCKTYLQRINSTDFNDRVNIPTINHPMGMSYDPDSGGCWVPVPWRIKIFKFDINANQEFVYSSNLQLPTDTIGSSSKTTRIVELN